MQCTRKVQVKKSGPSVSAFQNDPAVSVSVPEASSEPTVAGFPLHIIILLGYWTMRYNWQEWRVILMMRR